MNQNNNHNSKKKYHTPRISEYGDVQELTDSNVSMKKMPDGTVVYGNKLKTQG